MTAHGINSQQSPDAARQAQRVLLEAGRALTDSIDYDATLQNVAGLLVPALADWCAVDLLEGDRLVPVAAMHTEPAKVDLIHELRRRYPAKVSERIGAPNVIRTGRPELYEELTDEHLQLAAADEEHLRILRSLELRSAIIAPLVARGHRLGAITLISEQPRRYSQADLPLIEELGRRCGLAVDNARSYRDLQREVMEHRRTQQSLREGEQRFRAIFDQAAVGVAQTDADGRFVMVNDRYCQFLGYPRDQLIGRQVKQFIHPEDAQTHRKTLRRLVQRETASLSTENRYIRRNGAVRWGRVHASAITDEHGQLAYLLGVVEDIDEQKRTQQRTQMEHAVSQALAANETFEQAIPSMLQGLCDGLECPVAELWLPHKEDQTLRCVSGHLHRDDLRYEGFMRQSRRHRFVAGEGLPGRVWATREPAWITEMHADENFPRADLASEAGLHTGMAFPIQTGEEFIGVICLYARLQMVPDQALLESMATVGNECGHFIRRRRAEQQIQASELRKSAILESSLDCIMTMDAQGRIVDFNPAAERTFGYRREDVIGRFLADIVIPESLREQHWQGLKRYLETGRQRILERRIEMPAMRADGREFPAELTIAATDLDGQPFFTGNLRDITETKHAREQLEARARQQAAVAAFGQRALSGAELQELFDEAVHIVADTLSNELCKILRLLPDGDELLLEAGVGWQQGLVGRGRVSSGLDSQAGYTLNVDQPVVVEDLRHETRFSGPPLLHDHGVVSGISTIIAGEGGRPWGVLGTHTRQRRDYSPDDVNFLQAMANILATAIQRKANEHQLQRLNETLEQRVAERTATARQRAAQLQRMAAELTQTEQRERRRLAEILHDHLQQLLAASKLHANILREQVEDTGLKKTAEKLNGLLGQSIEMSRSLTAELSPPILYEAGLVPALQWLGRWMEDKHELSVAVEGEDQVDLADEDLRILAFQAVRELLFNTVKHAGVREARVRLRRRQEACVEIEVVDEGCGFDPAQAYQQQDQGGFGLFSIRERLELLGGRITISSRPGDGTRITLLVPLTRPEVSIRQERNR